MVQTDKEEATGCLKIIGISVIVLIGLSLISILFYAVFGDQESMNKLLYGGDDEEVGAVSYIRFVLILGAIAAGIILFRYWRNTNKKN